MVSAANCERVCKGFGPTYVFQYRADCKGGCVDSAGRCRPQSLFLVSHTIMHAHHAGCKCSDYSKYQCGVTKAFCTKSCTYIKRKASWAASVTVAGKACKNACKCV